MVLRNWAVVATCIAVALVAVLVYMATEASHAQLCLVQSEQQLYDCELDLATKELSLSIAETDLQLAEDELSALHSKFPLSYFESRYAIDAWLSTVPKLGVSGTIEEWYQSALYYQRLAIDSGYVVSVALWYAGNGVTIWCEVITQGGDVYYFDPDNCELINAYFYVDMGGLFSVEGASF